MSDYDIDKVSPRPWSIESVMERDILDSDKLGVIDTGNGYEEVASPEDVAHIVHCVNTHDALVAENERLKKGVDDLCTQYNNDTAEIASMTKELVTALENCIDLVADKDYTKDERETLARAKDKGGDGDEE